MTDDERRTRQPLSMTRRYRRGLILTGLLCALAVLAAATVLFQRSYAERIDNYLMQICHGYAAAYEAQDTHNATTLLNLLPEDRPLRITLIDTDGTVLYDTKLGSYIVDVNGDIYAAYKKTSGEAAYNSWVDHVRDDGDGKFTVVRAVTLPPDAHTDYVELPAERNAAGDFVFTDYLYWDRSE